MPPGLLVSGIMCYFRQLLTAAQFFPERLPRSVRPLAGRIAAEWVKENGDLTPARGLGRRSGTEILPSPEIIPRYLYCSQGNPEKYGKNFARPLKFN